MYAQLNKEFKDKIDRLLENCLKRGVEMRIREGIRHPLIQANYWRQSRSTGETADKIRQLKSGGAAFLAYCLEKAATAPGKHATNAIPGLSWHQWGEAADFDWMVNGKPCHDTHIKINNLNGYEVYAMEARRLDLECGFFWTSFPDACHIQLRAVQDPSKLYSLQEIDNRMSAFFATDAFLTC